ncbi:MAG TPA: hypothetical protein VIT22_09645 [Pseudoxanthomonas sp.]
MHQAAANLLDPLYLHVRILLGMVVGLALTHLLRNFARIIDRPQRHKIYWVHALWACFMFLYLLHFWWWEFRLSHLLQWTFVLYLFVTLYALLLYLLCAVVFPEDMASHDGYRDYFFARRKWIFGLLALVFAVDLCDTWIKGEDYFHSFGLEYPMRNSLYIVGSLVAIATRNRWYHAAFAVLALLYQLSWIVRQFETL